MNAEESKKFWRCNICQISTMSVEELKKHKNKYHQFGKKRFDSIKKLGNS